jgi:hypothetical protein
MLNIEQFNVGENYITAKIQDNQGDPIIVNIQEGNYASELQENLFKLRVTKFLGLSDNKDHRQW